MNGLLCHLPREMVVEIMSWIPADSLVEFKRVSKPWHALITELIDDSSFVSVHLSNTKQTSTSVIFSQPGGHRYSLLTIFHSDRFNCRALPSIIEELDPNEPFYGHGRWWSNTFHCDGIVCVVENISTVCLCNPILRERRIISAFTNVKFHGFGFGYDSRAKDYKFVRIFPFGYELKPEVYSVNNDSWNVIEMPENLQRLKIAKHKGLYARGVCYWSVNDDQNTYRAILCFDMSDEEFYLVKYPVGDNSSNLSMVTENLTVWNNSFSVIFRYVDVISDIFRTFIDVFTLDGRSDKDKRALSWTKHRFAGPPRYSWEIYWCLENNELLRQSVGKELVTYNLYSQKFRDVIIKDADKLRQVVYFYTKSLVSVKKRQSNKKKNSGD